MAGNLWKLHWVYYWALLEHWLSSAETSFKLVLSQIHYKMKSKKWQKTLKIKLLLCSAEQPTNIAESTMKMFQKLANTLIYGMYGTVCTIVTGLNFYAPPVLHSVLLRSLRSPSACSSIVAWKKGILPTVCAWKFFVAAFRDGPTYDEGGRTHRDPKL